MPPLFGKPARRILAGTLLVPGLLLQLTDYGCLTTAGRGGKHFSLPASLIFCLQGSVEIGSGETVSSKLDWQDKIFVKLDSWA